MKIKEEYCNEFKCDSNAIEIEEQKILKEKDGIILYEQIFRKDDLPYSTYLLYDMKYNESYLKFFVPDPRIDDIRKTIYLKYQVGIRDFMLKFFDVFMGDKENIEKICKLKQKEELFGEKCTDDCGSVLIRLIDDESYVLGMIQFLDSDQNTRVATNFIKYFEGGQDIDFSKEVGTCPH